MYLLCMHVYIFHKVEMHINLLVIYNLLNSNCNFLVCVFRIRSGIEVSPFEGSHRFRTRWPAQKRGVGFGRATLGGGAGVGVRRAVIPAWVARALVAGIDTGTIRPSRRCPRRPHGVMATCS
jgi:hypothetical protein